ncbi:hypothetical protein A6U89_30590 [Agrobacterium sp. B133/95]|nr:hypothetical protein A6U88_30750 [Agrobacterium sp. B131/95]OCJ24383.1 hypothetical protein A6U89_30590 [Agrobacterium sp. B133/95]
MFLKRVSDLIRYRPGDGRALDIDPPFSRPSKAAEHVEQCGLAAAALIDQRQHLPLAHLQVGHVQRLDITVRPFLLIGMRYINRLHSRTVYRR